MDRFITLAKFKGTSRSCLTRSCHVRVRRALREFTGQGDWLSLLGAKMVSNNVVRDGKQPGGNTGHAFAHVATFCRTEGAQECFLCQVFNRLDIRSRTDSLAQIGDQPSLVPVDELIERVPVSCHDEVKQFL